MRVENPIPNDKISDFVQNMLVIENFQVVNPFALPLYANVHNPSVSNNQMTHQSEFQQPAFILTNCIPGNFDGQRLFYTDRLFF